MPRPPVNAYQDMLDESRRFYNNQPAELDKIDEFDQDYEASQSIRWYTRDSFLYRLLNKALRTKNILIILKFRFILQDINKQLKDLQHKQKQQTNSHIKMNSTFLTVHFIKDNRNFLLSCN
jgi:hypothetical protein